jgi:hypothetical protein
MAKKTLNKISPGPKLDALTAEKVFGWKNVFNSKEEAEHGRQPFAKTR